MEINQLLESIKNAAFNVRLILGPGYLESVYQNALIYELQSQGISVVKEAKIPVYYKNIVVGDFRADILVENKIILEIKAVEQIIKSHEIQLVNYLTATGLDYGFVINYGGDKFRIIKKTRLYKP